MARDDAGRYFAVQMFGRPRSAAIRFSVHNDSAGSVAYRAGETAFSLAPRVTRTHTVCRPVEVAIERPGTSTRFKSHASDGARFTITAGGVVARRARAHRNR